VERDLNRWLPIVKWLLAIPHIIVLFVLSIGAIRRSNHYQSRFQVDLRRRVWTLGSM